MASYYAKQAFDNMLFGDEDDDRCQICRYCGQGPFFWEQFDRGWRLVDDFGQIHSCPEFFARKKRSTANRRSTNFNKTS